MNRIKMGVSAVAGGCLVVLERSCKTVEAVHTLDFVTHIDQSPTLGKMQVLLGSRIGLAILLMLIVVLGGTVVRLRRERRASKQALPPAHPPVPTAPDPRALPRRGRIRRVVVERERERIVIEEGDP